MGMILVRDGVVLAWGCARAMIPFDVEEPEEGDRRPAKKAKKQSGRIDLHAEADALTWAARKGVAVEGASAYITSSPCAACFSLLCGACVSEIVFCGDLSRHAGDKGTARMRQLARAKGIQLVENVSLPQYEPVTTETRQLFVRDCDVEPPGN